MAQKLLVRVSASDDRSAAYLALLLVGPDLIELVCAQLVHFDLFYFATCQIWRGHGPLHVTD